MADPHSLRQPLLTFAATALTVLLLGALLSCSQAQESRSLERRITEGYVPTLRAALESTHVPIPDGLRLRCRERVRDASDLVQYVRAALERDLESAQASLASLHYWWSCLGAQDFAEAYRSLTGTILTDSTSLSPQEREVLAPVLFLIADLGGRYLDNAAYEWLASQRESLRDALDDSESSFSLLRLYASRSPYAEALSRAEVGTAVDLFPYLSRSHGACAFNDLIQVESAPLPVCPDDCAFLSAAANRLPESEGEISVPEACSSLGTSDRGSAVGGDFSAGVSADIAACLQDFATGSGQPACVLGSLLERRGQTLGQIGALPSLDVSIGNDCRVMQGGDGDAGTSGNDRDDSDDDAGGDTTDDDDGGDTTDDDSTGDSSDDDTDTGGAQPVDSWTEEDEQELQEALDELDEAVDNYYSDAMNQDFFDRWSVVFGGKNDAAAAAQERINEATKRVRELVDKKFGNNQTCLPDQPCSNSCGLEDEFASQINQCYFPEEPVDPDGGQPAPVDPPQSAFGPELGDLQQCLLEATGQQTDLTLDSSACSTILCEQGRTPVDVNGVCMCETAAPPVLPEGPPCETVILCEPDTPCSCGGRDIGSSPELPTPLGPVLQLPVRSLEELERLREGGGG